MNERRQKLKDRMIEIKTQIPKTSKRLVAREGLMHQIKESDERIIVFHAGAGFGKTTAMAEWAKKYDVSCSWYRLSECDNDPLCFLKGVSYAFLRTCPANRKQNEALKIKAFDNVEELYENFWENCVPVFPSEPMFICFDDFQEIKDEKIFKIIESILDYGEGKIRMLFAVKGKFPSFLASYLMEEKALLIDSGEMCFQIDETRKLLFNILGEELSEKIVINVHNYTQGWPAGIAFAARGLKGKRVQTGDMKWTLGQTHVDNYILHKIYGRLSCGLRQFLTGTSVLDSINADICNFVMEKNNSKEILDYLVKENLFLYKDKSNPGYYRYQLIFASFLQTRLEPGLREKILLRAAEYFIREGQLEQGVQYAAGCQEREKLDESVLFSMYCYYRKEKQEKRGIDILYEAATRAYQREHYEIYGKYMCELVEYSKNVCGIIPAEEWTMEAGERLSNRITSYSPKISLYRLEFRLQMEDYRQLAIFIEISRDEEKMRRYHLNEIRRLVCWALAISKNENDWNKVVKDARFAARISKVYAEYGFYIAARKLYELQNQEIINVLQEGTAINEKSSFHYWMRLLMLLEDYKGGKKTGTDAKKELNQIEDYKKKAGLDFPNLREEDIQVLQNILIAEIPQKYMLKVKCLGTLLVEGKKGTVIWRTKKTKELFACLFYQNGRGVEKELLMDRLWPDTNEKNASILFNTTVSYLRKALIQAGAEEILTVKNRVYTLDVNDIESDLACLLEWNRMVGTKEMAENKNVMEVADLYQGDYLQGEDYIWLGAYREYVEQTFLQTIGRLAEIQMERNNYGQAVLLLQKGIEVDEYAVTFYERLICCLILSGDIKGAKKQYERLDRVSREELGQELLMEFKDYLEASKKGN